MGQFSLRQLLAGIAVAGLLFAVLRFAGLLAGIHCLLLAGIYCWSPRLPVWVRAVCATIATIFALMVQCLDKPWWSKFGYNGSVLYGLITAPIKMGLEVVGWRYDTVTYGAIYSGGGLGSGDVRPGVAAVFWSSIATVLWLTFAIARIRKNRRQPATPTWNP